MRKLLLVVLTLSTFSFFPKVAMADTFAGACTFTGTAHISPGAGALLKPASFTFATDGGPRNKCSGKLNGVNVVNVQSSAVATGTGKLGCSASDGKGTGMITIAGKQVNFKITIVGTGPEVTLDVAGTGGGVATGQASFATDTDAPGDCKANDATDLSFIIAALAINLKD